MLQVMRTMNGAHQNSLPVRHIGFVFSRLSHPVLPANNTWTTIIPAGLASGQYVA
jgi:hypothetical protein